MLNRPGKYLSTSLSDLGLLEALLLAFLAAALAALVGFSVSGLGTPPTFDAVEDSTSGSISGFINPWASVSVGIGGRMSQPFSG